MADQGFPVGRGAPILWGEGCGNIRRKCFYIKNLHEKIEAKTKELEPLVGDGWGCVGFRGGGRRVKLWDIFIL